MIIRQESDPLRDFLVTESVLRELAEYVHEKYLELMKASEAERAGDT